MLIVIFGNSPWITSIERWSMLLFLSGVFPCGFSSCRFFCQAGFIAKQRGLKRVMVFLCLFFSVSLRFLRTWLSVLPVRFSILSCLVFVVHVNFLNPLANKFMSLRTIAANSLIKSRGVDCCYLRWYVINGLGLKRMRRMYEQLWLYLIM